MKPLLGACSQAHRIVLKNCLEHFLTRRPLLQSTPKPKEDPNQARILKPAAEIEAAWQTIFARRRKVEPDDRRPIYCRDKLAKMWTDWQKEWFTTDLTPQQKTLKHSEKTSIWNVYIKREMGRKHFVMAFWQTGVPWAPPLDMLNSNSSGALEHVATHFAQWTRQLARSVLWHRSQPCSEEARTRSGHSRGQHGLTDQEVQDREDKRNATRDYYWGSELHVEDLAARGLRRCQSALASKTKGKGKKRDHQGRGAAEHAHRPRHYEEMLNNEQWLVHYYRNGAQQFLCVSEPIQMLHSNVESRLRSGGNSTLGFLRPMHRTNTNC